MKKEKHVLRLYDEDFYEEEVLESIQLFLTTYPTVDVVDVAVTFMPHSLLGEMFPKEKLKLLQYDAIIKTETFLQEELTTQERANKLMDTIWNKFKPFICIQ